MSSVPAGLAPPPPPPPARRPRRWLLRFLVALLVLVAILAGCAWWLLGTEGGARLIVEQVKGFAGEGAKIEGIEGRIFGGLRVKQIEVDRPDVYIRLQDVELDATPPLRGRLDLRRASVRSIEVRTASTGEAAKIPVSFRPPYPVTVESLEVGELRLGELVRGAPRDANRARDVVVRNIRIKASGDERHWNIAEASADTPYGRAKLAGTLGTTAPFALDAKGELAGRYGEREFRVGLVAKGDLKSFEANLDGNLGATPATAAATIEPFNTVPVKSLAAQVKGLDVHEFVPGAPVTKLDVEAKLVADGRAFAGPVRIVNAEPGPLDRQRLPVRSATGRVVVGAAKVEVLDAVLALAGGGTAAGRATVEKGRVEANFKVEGTDLAALHTTLRPTRLAGNVALTSTAQGQRFEGQLRDPRFAVEGRGTVAADTVSLETVRLGHASGAISGKGTLGLKGARPFRFEGEAAHFDPSAIAKVAAGDLNFAFVATGTLSPAIAGEARLDFAPSRYAGLPAGGRAHVAGDRNRIARADVDVTLGDARLKAAGSFGRAGDAMDVSFAAPNLAVLAKPFGVTLAGKVEGEGRLTGTFAAPAGRVSLTGANLALPSNVFVREVALRAEAGVDPASRIEGNLQAKGVAVGDERPPTPLAETLAATLSGTRAAHRLAIDALLTKDQRATAAFEGGLDARAKVPSWSGQVQSLALTGPSAFALVAPASLALAPRRVELGDARLKGEWGEARLAVTRWTPQLLELRGSSPGLAIRTTARALRLPTVRRGSDLVMAADWDLRAGENFDGTATLKRVSGDLRVGEPALQLGLQEILVKLEAVRGRARAVVDLRADRIGRVQGEGTALLVRGKSGWEVSAGGPINARLEADVPDLAPLSAWLGQDARLGGRVRGHLVVTGSGREPSFNGEARAEGLRVREPASGLEIDQGQVALRIRNQAITIEQFTATAPWNPSEGALAKLAAAPRPAAGRLTAEGGVDLKARTGSIRIRAESVPVTQLATRFVAISGEAQLEARPEGMAVTGALKADAAWVGALATPLPTVSDDVVVVRAARPAAADDDAPKPRERMRVDVRLALGDHVYFQGRGLDTRLAGNLRLVGDTSALRATGAIRTVDGTYDGYGQKLEIERGTLTFAGPVDNPTLNVMALRRGLPVEAGVEVYGTATRPRVRLVSRPDVPEPEKLSWLVLGRGPAEANQADASTLMAAARAMLGTGAPGGDLVKRFGFDEVRIGRPDAASALGALPQSTVAGKTGSASAADVVTVGKRLTKDVHVIYEQGLADAEGALRVTWQITRQFQLLLRAGYLPGLDAVYRWTFY